ncbi:MAG: hypothetical protein AAGI37_18100 [Planctomycetota bacterium]
MHLDLGGLETITDPTLDQIAHHLRYMPAESPFIVLDRGQEEFVQATIEAAYYRVEHRKSKLHRFCLVDYKKAVSIFEAFHSHNSLNELASWKKLYLTNPKATKWVAISVTVILLGLMSLGIWHEVNQWLEIYR